MAYIGKEPVVGNFQVCDSISVVNGQAAYTLQVSSTNVVPESSQHCLVSLNGILQAPVTSFTVSGSTLTFASNLATNDVIDFVILLGNVLDLGVPSDGVITNAKLSGDLISGETDIGGALADADLILVDDGAGGTLRKCAMSRVKTYAGGANTPAFSVILSGNVTGISDNTWTKIAFNSEVFDTDSCFDPSSNYRFTPTTSGKYFFSAQWGNGDGGPRAQWISIYKNGSEAFTNYFYAQDSSTIDDFTPTINGIIDMNGSSDYVEFYMKQLIGSGSGVQLVAGDKTTWAYGYKIIGA